LLLFLLCTPALLYAQVLPSCLKNYSTDLIEVSAFDRRLILSETAKMGRDGRDGLKQFLEYRNLQADAIQRLANALRNMKSASVKSRFANPEEFFEAVRRINARSPNGIPQEGRVLAEIGQTGGNPGLTQGSLFEIYASDVGGVPVAAFREELSGNGWSYVADITFTDGRRREVKAYFEDLSISQLERTNPPLVGDVFLYTDVRVNSMAEEMTRILLTNENRIGQFGFDFPLEIQSQDGLIKELLSMQLTAPRVRAAFQGNPTRLAALENALSNAMAQFVAYK
jgi:hypothetical protein